MAKQTKQKTIQKLIEVLQENQSAKLDLVIPAKNISIQDGLIHLSNIHEFNTLFDDADIQSISLVPSKLSLEQLADKLVIGRTFQRKLVAENMPLFEHIVNELLKQHPAKKFLFRIAKEADNYTCRAVLSNAFKIIDNLSVLQIVLDAIEKTGIKAVVQSHSIHNKRFVVKFLFDSPNDQYQCGLSVANSEVGFGKFSVASFIEKENICFIDSDKFEKTHLGSRMNLGNHKQQNLAGKENLFDEIVYFIDQMKDSSFYAEKIANVELFFADSLQEPYDLANAMLKKVISSHKENDNFKRIFDKQNPNTSIGLLKCISEYIGTYHPEELYSFESISVELLWEIDKNKI